MSFKKIICSWFECSKDCEKRNKSLLTSLNECEKEKINYIDKNKEKQLIVETLTKTYNKKNTQYNQLKQLYNKLLQEGVPVEDEQEVYWNNKYPKKDIVYNGRWIKVNGEEKELNVDVRNYFTPYDSKIPIVSGETSDERALKALKYVIKKVKYINDKKTFGEWEYWLFPFETLAVREGDCEDGAILLANIMLKSGIPYWRIRLNAGDVKGGGHCYVTYCRETDNEFVVLDWCYWQNTKEVKNRLKHSEERNYYSIWFSWNKKYSFAKNDYLRTAIKKIPVGVKR